jgi:hypothetical protein
VLPNAAGSVSGGLVTSAAMELSPMAQLKFKLMANGISVRDEARDAWRARYGGPLTLAEYATTSGVALVLPGGVYVNAPLVDGGLEEAELGLAGDQFAVRTQCTEVPVEVVPVPAYHSRIQADVLNGTTQPYTNYGVTHTDRCRVSPISGCAWKCHFCDLPYEFAYRKRHEDNLLEVINAAEDDPIAPARHVLISGGTPRAPIRGRAGRPESNDEAWLDHVFEHLAERSPLPVDVMMPPRRDPRHPEWLRSVGVNMVSINLEVSDPGRARSIAPAKARLGRDYTLAYIERAVEAFGVGQVQSLVVFGRAIEPMESTLRGVRDLVERGCMPVLSPFRPHHLTPLSGSPGATYDEMVEAYLSTLDICSQVDNGVQPGPRCIPCHHNTATVPDGGSFYCDVDADLTSPVCC